MRFGFIYSGRLGNNIIQYIATELIAMKYGGEVISNYEKDSIKIDDKRWVHLMENDSILEDGNYVLEGYFQRGDIFLKYKDKIHDLINSEYSLYHNLKFKDIFKNINIDKEAIVVHLRLDDFNFQGRESNIVDPSFFIKEIKNSGKTNVILVIDKLRYTGEQKYIKLIIDGCKDVKFTIQQSDILYDWNTLRCSNYTISSNSSFAWIACFFGMVNKDAKFIYPNTGFYKEQKFNIQTENFTSHEVGKINFMLI
jgi:hypothetical protein